MRKGSFAKVDGPKYGIFVLLTVSMAQNGPFSFTRGKVVYLG